MTTSRQTPANDTDIEMEVPLDTVCFIITKAREFDVKAGSSDPDAPSIDDDNVDAVVLEDRPSDPAGEELMSMISDLSDDAQIDLVTLMWLGRDDLSAAEWDETRTIATDEHNDKTATYLCGTPLLADHLESGLDAIGLNCADYNETSI